METKFKVVKLAIEKLKLGKDDKLIVQIKDHNKINTSNLLKNIRQIVPSNDILLVDDNITLKVLKKK